MTQTTRLILFGLVALPVLWLGWVLVNSMYFSPRADLLAERERLEERVGQYRDGLDARRRLVQRLQGYADQTLGGSVETVDHRLRTRLNRLAEHVELRGASVSTSGARPRPSPGRADFRGRRDLQDELDFVEIDGTISGDGAIDQVVALIDAIEREPWLKRIHTLRLDPRENGRRFGVTIRLTTMFMPGYRPDDDPAAGPPAADRQRLAGYAALVEANPFHLPPEPEPEPEPEPVAEASEPEPPPFPYGRWRLVGIAHGPTGVEFWLRNVGSGESRVLRIGERIGEVHFRAEEGDAAVVELDGRIERVEVGRTLGDRIPINR